MGWQTSNVPAGNTTSPPLSGRRFNACWISALVTPADNITVAGFRTGICGAIRPAVEKASKHTHKAFFVAFTLLT